MERHLVIPTEDRAAVVTLNADDLSRLQAGRKIVVTPPSPLSVRIGLLRQYVAGGPSALSIRDELALGVDRWHAGPDVDSAVRQRMAAAFDELVNGLQQKGVDLRFIDDFLGDQHGDQQRN